MSNEVKGKLAAESGEVIGSVLLGFCFNNLALVAEQFRSPGAAAVDTKPSRCLGCREGANVLQ